MAAFYRVEDDGDRVLVDIAALVKWESSSEERVSNTLVSWRRRNIGRDLQLHGPRNRDRWACAQA